MKANLHTFERYDSLQSVPFLPSLSVLQQLLCCNDIPLISSFDIASPDHITFDILLRLNVVEMPGKESEATLMIAQLNRTDSMFTILLLTC
ncbi:hypothetical protein M514_02633, partial [Trichuris suis]